ncbi:MAG: hypothetical protein QOG23_5918, partial [Blastocatellia bacterium]|nr:hypothetical protein [Blastocatellia bacterium]
ALAIRVVWLEVGVVMSSPVGPEKILG